MPATDPPFVVDLHAHFPMQIDPKEKRFRHALHRRRKHEKLSDRIKFLILRIADRFFNREEPTDGHAVTIDTMTAGNVGVALSTAYCPFLELDVEVPYGGPPQHGYFHEMKGLLERVEDHVRGDARVEVVRDWAGLVAARAAGKLALVHAIEGGFHLAQGGAAEIDEHVEKLAKMGLGYVTVAHLFYRDVATNVPALPFLSDATYDALFHQPDVGLTQRGRDLVAAMAKHGVLIDVTHMSERGMDETFALLDQLDPAKKVPVIASHVACRHPGGYAYNLEQRYVAKIAERGGVCGIIYCDHHVRDGQGARTKTFDESFTFIQTLIAQLRAWGGDDVLAIGSDLDGFIKPTLAGLDSAASHRTLATALESTYGPALAKKICHENALRVLEAGWRRGVCVEP